MSGHERREKYPDRTVLQNFDNRPFPFNTAPITPPAELKIDLQEPMVRAALNGDGVTFSPGDPGPVSGRPRFGDSDTGQSSADSHDLGRSLRSLDKVRWGQMRLR